jgi:hypothetical protein
MDRYDEEAQKVVMTADDFKNIEEFFTHFKIPMPELLTAVIAEYRANPGKFEFDDQRKLRVALAHAVITAEHPLLKDDVFKNIRANCDKAFYDGQFQYDLENILVRNKTSE